MQGQWRISTFNATLLASYFIPAWTLAALKICVSPVHGLYDRANIAAALFVSDHLQFIAMGTVRFGWLLALGKFTVAAFFGVFVVMICRRATRNTGGTDEALSIALALGGLISFVSMIMASRVGEAAALRLHATESLMLVGAIILLLVDRRPADMESPFAANAPAYPLAYPLTDPLADPLAKSLTDSLAESGAEPSS